MRNDKDIEKANEELGEREVDMEAKIQQGEEKCIAVEREFLEHFKRLSLHLRGFHVDDEQHD